MKNLKLKSLQIVLNNTIIIFLKKKNYYFVLLISLSLLCYPSSQAQNNNCEWESPTSYVSNYNVTAKASYNMRGQPREGCDPVGKMEAGHTGKVVAESGNWRYVKVNQLQKWAWVHKNAFSSSSTTPPTTTGNTNTVVWDSYPSGCNENGKRSIGVKITNTSGQSHSYKIVLFQGIRDIMNSSTYVIGHTETKRVVLQNIPSGNYGVRLKRDGTSITSKTFNFGNCDVETCCIGNKNTAAYWRCRTYEEAGIYDWDVDKDLEFNKFNAVAVYNYYAYLYKQKENKFYWPALARVVGKDFFGAFKDIHIIRRDIENNRLSIDEIYYILEIIINNANPPNGIKGTLRSLLDFILNVEDPQEIAKELKFMEHKFLSMQKQIFDDIAWQHRAYLEGGNSLIDNILVNDPTIQRQMTTDQIARLRAAWKHIENGRPDKGAEEITYVEQRIIIQDEYTEIWDNSNLNKVLITIMSLISTSPIENGNSFLDEVIFGDVNFFSTGFPYIFNWDIDLTANLANEKDRWKWIKEDMIPVFSENLKNRKLKTLECLNRVAKINDVDKSRVHSIQVLGLLKGFPLRGDDRDRSLKCDIDYKISYHQNEDSKLENLNVKNYPNPFKDLTTIEFDLQVESKITIKVYNSNGAEIATLIDNKFFEKGENSVSFNGSNYPAGIYHYTIKANDKLATQKMIIAR